MTTSNKAVTRRNWLGLISASSLTSVGLASTLEAQTGGVPAGDSRTLGLRSYNIRDFGARGDGKTLDTAAVQAAIDACHKEGGGMVLVPAGVFLIGTIEMKSNVTLHIVAQGKLLGTPDGKQYHAASTIPLRGDSTLEDGNVGLIFAVNAENITIEGSGTIDGQGTQFRSERSGVPPPSGRGENDRPYHLLFYRCRNLRVRNIFLVACAYHSIRVVESSFFWADSVRIYNRVNENNDGFHFISSEYVHISNCDVQSQDDACALFGSCKNVTVTNSTFSTRWAVFRFGFERANPENITVSNCVIYETYGCPIKMLFGPESRAQNILFSNLIMQDVTGPISIDLDARPRQHSSSNETPRKGYVRNISFNGIRAQVAAEWRRLPDIPFEHQYAPGETRQCIVLNCVGDSYLEDIALVDVHVTYGGGGTAEEAAREFPPIAGEYFEAGTPPAYGLYARKVRGLTLSGVRFGVLQPDLRPAVVLDHVIDAAINSFSTHSDLKARSVVRCIETRDVLISATRLLGPARAFLQIEGPSCQGITIDGGDLSKAAQPLAIEAGASAKAAKIRA